MLLFAVPTSAAAWAPLSAQPARPFTPAAARRAVGAAPLMQQQGLPVAPAPFNQTTAVLAAGFAFEAYNEPSEQDARWERGADGCDVAFMSEEFAREVYAGRLEVRLVQAKELSTEQDLAQTLMSGGQRDPYVIFAMNEENEQGPKEGAIGLGRAVDRARSSTVWSKSVAEQAKDGFGNLFKGGKQKPEEGSAVWPENEVISLYVKDPSRAQLALTVFDEEVAAADKPLGATSVHLVDLVRPEGGESQRTKGVDWSTLSRRVGTVGTDENAQFELCCFLTHTSTSSEAAIWRDRSRRLVVVAFRGTSDIMDVLTDVNLLQTPLEQGYDGQKSDDPRQVHSGFFAAARTISRRIKELLVSATAGTPGEWDLLITGHSLGGALAQLMSTELVGSVDTSRGFKTKDDSSLFGVAKNLFFKAKQNLPGGALPKWRSVALYTYGAPRVGNTEFARYFEQLFAGREAFRIVNDRDIVPRLPRHGNALGNTVLDYEHVGRTVLIADKADAAEGFDGFWVEGTSDEAVCPLRDVSPISNPFTSGNVLGDLSSETASFASKTWSSIDAAAKIRSRSELKKAVESGLSDFEKTKASITSRVAGMSAGEALSMFGLDKRFVESELAMIDSLAKGKAIEHHLEPSYFVAMTKALDAAQNEGQA